MRHKPLSSRNLWGDVNVFHGHIDQGNLVIGEFAHNLQTHSNATHAVNNQSATAYIRPYELTLSRESHKCLSEWYDSSY